MSDTQVLNNDKSLDSEQQSSDLLRRFENLRDSRSVFESTWDEVARYMGPAYMGFASPVTHPLSTGRDIVDSTARRSANIFAAGMLSGASSPSGQWFSLGVANSEIYELEGVRPWLQKVEDLIYSVLLNQGFYPQQTVAYHQAGLFGWQCLFVDEDIAGGIHFQALPLTEIYIADNHQGRVDTVFRKFRLTARQAAQKWGREKLSAAIGRALDRGREQQEFSFIHAVYPATEQDKSQGQGRSGFEYVSYYLEAQGKRILSKGGYVKLPYIISRAQRIPGMAYGYSPGTEALADTKMINEMKKLILEAGQLAVAPPYLVPDDGFVGRFSFEPRAMNYYRRTEGNSRSDFGPLSIGGNPNFSYELLKTTKQDINKAFFVDLFLTIRERIQMGGSPSATEVTELAGERMFLLGPMLLNQQQENFSNLFDRLLEILYRRQELPPVPPSLMGQSIQTQYISPLMLAQKESQNKSLLRTYSDISRIASISPEVMDVFNHDENIRRIMQNRGLPQSSILSKSAVDRIRDSRQQAMQQQQQSQMIEKLANIYPKLGVAPKAGSPAAEIGNILKENATSDESASAKLSGKQQRYAKLKEQIFNSGTSQKAKAGKG